MYCPLPFQRAKVCADGKLNMCCHQSELSYLGNLLEQSFEDLWFGILATEIRDVTLSGKLHPACKTLECPYTYGGSVSTGRPKNFSGYPTEVEFDLHASHCNFGGATPTPATTCIMCPRGRVDFADHLATCPDYTDFLLDRIKHIIPDLLVLNILGLAEPFWKDKLFEVLNKIDFQRYKKKIMLRTTTNGTVFNIHRQQMFASMVNRSEICFSIDAVTRETYLKIRRHDLFDTVCSNLKNWSATRRQLNNRSRHKLIIHNNINMLNVAEVPQMIQFAKDMDVDYITLVPTHNCGTHEAVASLIANQQNYHLFERAQREAVQLAEKIGMIVQFSRPLALDVIKGLKVI